MNRIILFGILLILSLSGCKPTVDNGRGQIVSFTDLPQEVQDTVLYWTENYAPIFTDSDSLICLGEGMPSVISFDEKYTLTSVPFGPWIKHMLLTRISDGKKYKLKRNAPVPIIVRNDTLIISTDYNILTVWDPSIKWCLYKLP